MSPHTDPGALLKLADEIERSCKAPTYEVRLGTIEGKMVVAALRQAASQGSAGGERSEVLITGLVGEWQAEAKKHALAALEGDCDVGDDEWCLHRESARIYRKCADQLAASQPTTAAQAPWQLIETAHHKDGTRILGWDGKQQFTCFYRGEHHKPHQDKPGWFDQHIRMHPTHWQPLGASPPVPSAHREAGK